MSISGAHVKVFQIINIMVQLYEKDKLLVYKSFSICVIS